MALDKLHEEGMENVYERHANITKLTRDGIRDLGLELLVEDDRLASNTVTAVKMPEGIDGSKLMSLTRTDENVVLAGGQGKLSGKIFRIGHLGYVTPEDIQEVLDSLKNVLPKVGFRAY
jgi:aspartate aminotransferase-like enzyme